MAFLLYFIVLGILSIFFFVKRRKAHYGVLSLIAPAFFAIYNLKYHKDQTALMSLVLTFLVIGSLFYSTNLLTLLIFILYVTWGSNLLYWGAIPGTGIRDLIPSVSHGVSLNMKKPVRGLHLSVFQTGSIKTGSWGVYEGSSRPIIMDESSFLIEHPTHGLFLFETGIHPHVAEDPVSYVGAFLYYGGFLKMEQEKGSDIFSQLKKNDFDPDKIKKIYVSHLHPEHDGAVMLFPNADICIDSREHNYAFGNPKYNYFKKEYEDVKKWSLLIFETSHPFPPFEGAIDIFEDGSLLVVSTPGHTPGSISLLVNLESGPIFLVGDIIWRQENLTTKTIGMPFVSVDGVEHRKALGRLEAFIKMNPEITIVPSHDLRSIKERRTKDITIK